MERVILSEKISLNTYFPKGIDSKTVVFTKKAFYRVLENKDQMKEKNLWRKVSFLKIFGTIDHVFEYQEIIYVAITRHPKQSFLGIEESIKLLEDVLQQKGPHFHVSYLFKYQDEESKEKTEKKNLGQYFIMPNFSNGICHYDFTTPFKETPLIDHIQNDYQEFPLGELNICTRYTLMTLPERKKSEKDEIREDIGFLLDEEFLVYDFLIWEGIYYVVLGFISHSEMNLAKEKLKHAYTIKVYHVQLCFLEPSKSIKERTFSKDSFFKRIILKPHKRSNHLL